MNGGRASKGVRPLFMLDRKSPNWNPTNHDGSSRASHRRNRSRLLLLQKEEQVMLNPLIESLRTVVSTVNDRMHVMHAQGHLTVKELLAVQSEICAALNHLELASLLAAAIDNQIEEAKKPSESIDDAWDKKVSDEMDSWTKDSHPDNNDRDAGRVCPMCNHDLELNGDFRCTRCGAQH